MKLFILSLLTTGTIISSSLEVSNQYHLHLWAHYNHLQDNDALAGKCYTLLLKYGNSPYTYPSFLEFLFDTSQHPLVVQLTPVVERLIPLDMRSRFIFAQSLHHMGLTQEALFHLEHLNRDYPNKGEFIYAIAQIYLLTNRVPAALQLIENYLNNNPSREHLLAFQFLKAQTCILQQKYSAAQTALDSVVKTYPQCDKGWLLLGVVHELSGNPTQAIEHYQKYLHLAGSNKIVEEQLSRLKKQNK